MRLIRIKKILSVVIARSEATKQSHWLGKGFAISKKLKVDSIGGVF